jgi:DNA invertase Pin-like site-specific DNA recombinase
MTARKRSIADTSRNPSVSNSRKARTEAVSDGRVPETFSDSLLGYARVSTDKQDEALQVDALKRAGCRRIFKDVMSGVRDDRPELAHLLDVARAGDVVVVWRLDRLGRSLRHLLEVVEDLKVRGIGFRSLTESIDTTTAAGELVFHVFAALAQFERNLLRERTRAGLEAAKARGRVGGRPTVLTPEKAAQARAMFANKANVATVARVLGVGRATLYRWLESATDAPD